jgi:hypothetical protein
MYLHTAVMLNRKDMYVFGGQTNAGDDTKSKLIVSSLYKLDCDKMEWKLIKPEPYPLFVGADREQPFVSVQPAQTVHGTGGMVAPCARYGHTALEFRGSMVVFGGQGEIFLNDLWLYNPRTNRWTLLETYGTPPSPRSASLLPPLPHLLAHPLSFYSFLSPLPQPLSCCNHR